MGEKRVHANNKDVVYKRRKNNVCDTESLDQTPEMLTRVATPAAPTKGDCPSKKINSPVKKMVVRNQRAKKKVEKLPPSDEEVSTNAVRKSSRQKDPNCRKKIM